MLKKISVQIVLGILRIVSCASTSNIVTESALTITERGKKDEKYNNIVKLV